LKIPEEFKEAEVLAQFANLDTADAAAVAYFQNNYPDFAPAEWWDYTVEYGNNPNPLELVTRTVYGMIAPDAIYGVAPRWHETHSFVCSTWENEFEFTSIFVLTALLRSVFVGSAETARTASMNLTDWQLFELSTHPMYGFHNAVLYLYHQPWRAKTCRGCGKYFVANHPKREFCEYPDARGETCRYKNDNRRHLEYYHEAGKEKRQAKTRKSSPSLPGSRREKAAAKT
jgi:hypothetical protein